MYHYRLGLIACLSITQICNAFLVNSNHCNGFVSSRRSFQSSSTTSSSCSVGRISLSMSSYKQVFVAGGSRGVGRVIIDKLIEQESKVVTLVRSTEAAKTLNTIDGVTAIVGDAFDQKSVENAMDGCDAAITTLGGSTISNKNENKKRFIDYEGNNNVIESAGILGVQRIILVTSVGCGNSKDAAPEALNIALKDFLAAKEKAENVLIKYYTNTNWTIIRPGGLISEPSTSKAILTKDNTVIGSIHREDVADLVTQALNSPNTERQILTALDPTIPSATSSKGLSTVEVYAL